MGPGRRVIAVTLVLPFAFVLVPVRAPAVPLPGYTADAPFIRDGLGRAVFFHGVNAVWKQAPYYPPSSIYSGDPVAPAQSYFDGRDGDLFEQLGFNTVRLGLIWKGVEPTRGVFDDGYLLHMVEITDMLAAHHVAVLLDFHQDLFNELFQGEGFPDWAVSEIARDTAPTAKAGFPANYFTPPVMNAFDSLWADKSLWTDYAAAWQHVAHYFAARSNVLGYDLLNEPWPGTQWETCANPVGCPAFQLAILQPFEEQLAGGIRAGEAGSRTSAAITFWEPDVTNDFGTQNSIGTLSPFADANNGISFHNYCLAGGTVPSVTRDEDPECAQVEPITFQNQQAAAKVNHSALLLTEFGASDETGDIARILAGADANMVSWQYWQYGAWSDPTGNPGAEGLFNNDLDRFGTSGMRPKAALLFRPYPQAVAGTPTGWTWDTDGRVFDLTYQNDAALTAPTILYVPLARDYGNSYAIAATGVGCGGGCTVSISGNSVSVSAPDGGEVHVHIAPA